MTTSENAVVLYQSPDGSNSLEVRLDQETVWLTQKQMAELFQRERSVITKHLRNVFIEGELDEKAMCKICTLLFPTSRWLFITLT